MKRLGLFFVVFLCLGVFFAPSKIFAQSNGTACDYSDAGARDGTYQQGKCISNGTSGSQDSSSLTLGIDQMRAIIADGTNKIKSVPNYNNLSSAERNKQEAELYTIASNAFGKINPNSTFNAIAAEIYSKFSSYLASTIGTRSDGIINAQALEINNLAVLYSSYRDVEAGTMTDTQAELKNSQTRTSNAALAGTQLETNPCLDRNYFGIPNSITACAAFAVSDIIKTLVLSIAGFFLWAAANFLNFGIQVGILNFKSWAPDAIYPLWQMVRQIVSLCVIFAGLYMGFMYIIKSDTGEKFLKRYIPWLVMFALFVNFSYPIARVAIDISNVISLNIYASAVGSEALQGGFGAKAISLDGKNTAGSVIMDKLGLQGLVFSATGVSAGGVNQISGVAGTLLTIIFIFYATYIFGFAAILMMIRNITLVFGIIASPLLFVDAVIPKLGEKASAFRTFFVNQLFLSIVFMIMLYFTIAVMGIFNSINFSASGAGSDIATLAKVFISLVLLHTMLKVTRDLSGSIGASVEKMYKNAAFGVTGGVARATIGRAASAVAGSQWMKNREGSYAGEKLMSFSKGLANSTLDIRNSKITQSLAGMGGVELGSGSNKTYKGGLEAKQKAFATRYNNMNDKARDEFNKRYDERGTASRALDFVNDRDQIVEKGFKDRQREERRIEAALGAYDQETDQVKRKRAYSMADEDMRKRMDDIDTKKTSYSGLEGEDKRKAFNEETDKPYIQQALIGQDLQSALKENEEKKLEDKKNYKQGSGEDRQSIYNRQNKEDKEKMMSDDFDEAKAEVIAREKQDLDRKAREEANDNARERDERRAQSGTVEYDGSGSHDYNSPTNKTGEVPPSGIIIETGSKPRADHSTQSNNAA